MERTLYDILGVAPTAPPESVRAAYIDSIQAIGAFNSDAERLHGDLKEAFEVLIHPEGRRITISKYCSRVGSALTSFRSAITPM